MGRLDWDTAVEVDGTLLTYHNQNAQRLLWRNSMQDKELDTYTMQVMTFGAKCSPSITDTNFKLLCQIFKTIIMLTIS